MNAVSSEEMSARVLERAAEYERRASMLGAREGREREAEWAAAVAVELRRIARGELAARSHA